MKYLYQLILSICLLSTVSLTAQDQFERLYTTTDNVLSTSLHELGSGYLMLSLQINDEGENEKINLTNLDQKGTINWSNEYDFDLEEDVFISELGEVEVLYDGTIAFSALLQKDSLNKLVVKVDNQGNVLWTKLTGEAEDTFRDNGFRSNLVSMETSGVLHITNQSTDTGNNPFLSAIDTAGAIKFGQEWSIVDTNGNTLSATIRDATFLLDSTVMLVGNTMSEDHQLFLAKMDTAGQVQWMKSYTADLGSGLSQSAMSLDEMVDKSIVVLAAQAGSTSTGMILRVDSLGNYVESRSITPVSGGFDAIPIEIEALGDTSMAIAVKRLDLLSNEVLPVIIRMTMDSLIEYQTVLKASTGQDITRGGLVAPDSISPVFLTSSSRLDSTTTIPSLTKLDENGTTLCHDAMNYFRFDSIFFKTDTLTHISMIQDQMDSIDVLSLPYGNFDPPLLQLRDTSYCPQDPIMFTLDGTVRGATAYLWSDGVMDSIRVVTEPGEYILNVVVGIEECFTLCDTANITQSEFPMAEIEVNTANFCATGELALNVVASNPIVSIEWSTGQRDEPIIIVTDLMQYSAMIIDDCGNPAQAAIDLTDFSITNNPALSVSGENLCTNNTLIINATGDFLIEELMWSTGDIGVSSIVVSQPGEYTVENMAEFCPGETTIQIVENQFLTPLTVDINGNCDNVNNVFQLISGGSGIESFLWSTGETTAIIGVTEAGSYTVTVTDICGDTEVATITVSDEDIEGCIVVPPPPEGMDCLEWPNAIYPASNNNRNTTFGPEEMSCGNVTFNNYELSVYNRWGNKVFETDNINTRWNGMKNNNGKEQPATTYFYYASYSIDGDEFESEGDVTIIR